MRSVIVSVGVTGHCLDDNTPGAARGSRLYAPTTFVSEFFEISPPTNQPRDVSIRWGCPGDDIFPEPNNFQKSPAPSNKSIGNGLEIGVR
jgi:hypothetical protein